MQATVYDIREPSINSLRNALQCYNWNHVYLETDINIAYSMFLEIVKWHINEYIPEKHISLEQKPPVYITPLVKILLRRRNKIMRQGRMDEAHSLTEKRQINQRSPVQAIL